MFTMEDLLSRASYDESWDLVKTVFRLHPEMPKNEYKKVMRNSSHRKSTKKFRELHPCHSYGCRSGLGDLGQDIMRLAFPRLDMQNTNHRGFDYYDGPTKVDLKTASYTLTWGCKEPRYVFDISVNKIAGRFDLLFLDANDGYKPLKLMRVPAKEVNHLNTLSLRLDQVEGHKWYHLEKYSTDIAPLIEAWKELNPKAYMFAS